jgi:ubiquinone/menaquinone biosynthesis C-methylase UbiE
MAHSIYDLEIPENYHMRRLSNPLQAYLYDHWTSIIKPCLIKYCRNRTVLDLGCGTGEYINEVNEVACRVIGVDLSLNMLIYLKSCDPNSIVVNGSAYRLPFPNNIFDVVYSIGVLEYIQVMPVLQECLRVLKPNGTLVLTTPNRHSARKLVLRWLRRKNPRQSQAAYYSREQCIMFLSSAGYQIEEIIMNDGVVYLPGRIQKYIGRFVFCCFEKIMSMFSYNPLSENMMFIASKV